MDYPCIGCNEGWGQANPRGIESCHETCKKYWNWIKEDKKRDKPLKDWTLGEIKAECEKHECCTAECSAYKFENGCLWRFRHSPSTWDLAEPSRWTEQDKEDAKALKRLIPGAHHIWRYSTSSSLQLYGKYNNYILPLNNCFATLPPRERATLDEIIGDENNDS